MDVAGLTAALRDEVLDAPRRQAGSLREAGHRPWPVPRVPWVMGQSWRDLLFAHWPVQPERLAPVVPAGLSLDVRDGTAWVGVTPFEVWALHARLGPPLPPLSSFREINVRTYVTCEDRPGILFFTLDCSSRVAVAAARALYRLPYHHTAAELRRDDGWVDYQATRRELWVHARYARGGPPFVAAPGSLEAFLYERYCLYTASAGSILRADIHHRPWTLHAPVDGSRIELHVAEPPGPLEGRPLLHVAETQDVVIWPPTRVRPSS